MKLIVVPLLFLIAAALVGQTLGATGNVGTTYTTSTYGISGFYDADGHLAAFANHTAAGEAGTLTVSGGQNYATTDYYWTNETDTFEVYINNNTLDASSAPHWIMFGSSGFWFLLATLAAIMALGCVVGFHFLSSGENEFSTSLIVKGTAFGSLWAFFAAMSYSLFATIPLYLGTAFLFFLSFLYLAGIINQFGSPGDE